jgi:hypothetical protein
MTNKLIRLTPKKSAICSIVFFSVIALGAFLHGCIFGGNLLTFSIFFATSILAFNSYLLLRVIRRSQSQ